jgi:hypothetical protein
LSYWCFCTILGNVSKHVDHRTVHVPCKELFKNTLKNAYFEKYPQAMKNPGKRHALQKACAVKYSPNFGNFDM